MWLLYTMASASEDDDNLLKFFIYGKHISGRYLCLELNIDKTSRKITMITKAK